MSEYTIGFFGAATATGGVCVPSDVQESIPGAYRYSDFTAGTNYANVVDIELPGTPNGPSDTAFTYMGGGVLTPSWILYTNQASPGPCSATSLLSGNSIAVYHTLFTSDNDNNFLNIQAPFLMRNPFSNNSPLLDVVQTSSNLTVNWSEYPGASSSPFNANVNGFTSPVTVLHVYSPSGIPAVGMAVSTTASPNYLAAGTVVTNVTGSSSNYLVTLSQPTVANGLSPSIIFTPLKPYDGYKVFVAYSTNNSGINSNNSGNDNCSNLDSTIWTNVATVPINTTTSTITAIGSTNISSLPFATTNFAARVCAYKTVAGATVYLGQMASGQPQRGSANTNLKNVFGWAHSGTPLNITAQANYAAEVGGMTAAISSIDTSSSVYTAISLSTGNFDNGLNTSGGHNEVMIVVNPSVGCTVPAGSYDFARILEAATSNQIFIPRGTLADSLATQIPGNCSAQVALVPHFSDATISALLLASNYDGTNLNGGVVAFRVNQKLTVNAGGLTISASGNGYPAVSTNATNQASIGTVSEQSGSGGAGYGSGGMSIDGLLGGIGLMSSGNGTAFLGSGGGDLYGGGVGGIGGGLIYVAANLASISPGTLFSADGQGGSHGTFGAGGGGGGSVNLLFNVVQASSVYAVSANGGNAFAGGGGGGGGYVNVQACDLSAGPNSSSVAAGVANGNPHVAAPGYVQAAAPASSLQFCGNN